MMANTFGSLLTELELEGHNDSVCLTGLNENTNEVVNVVPAHWQC